MLVAPNLATPMKTEKNAGNVALPA